MHKIGTNQRQRT